NVHGASSPWGYRTRAQVRGQGRNMGFFEKHSRNLVAIEECPVLHPKIMEQWKRFRKEKAPELAGPNKEFKVEWTLRESGKVTEAVNQPHAALGFTQINSEGNATLKKIVETAAMRTTTKDLLWDLYGGTGNLVDLLIPSFETTLTVDAENQGVRYSSEQNETSGHTVVKAKTKTFLQLWSQSKDPKHPNCIVVDPPRTGLEDNAEKIAEVGAERVILVSCDPASLARDLTKFLALYEIRSLDLIDMFPQTYHLESVVELVRR
ncbi:MAG TPA: hypothetical protein PLH57_09480, partial [Oligoflexia bacterium]|nr:hypothetical protein [Oligoflexia bacterium]